MENQGLRSSLESFRNCWFDFFFNFENLFLFCWYF